MAVNGTVATTAWTDPTITAGATQIRAVHITQLRTAIQNLQNLAPNVTNCGYNACQSCQSIPCQTCQSVTCQTCQSQCVSGECDCSGSCFIAGTLILMADLSWKKIEDIVIGEQIIGLNNMINTVLQPYKAVVGNRRSMMTFQDKSIYWSSEHAFWIKHNGEEYFGTHDYNQYMREKNDIIPMDDGSEFIYAGLEKRHPIVITTDVEYAYMDGWKKRTAIIDRSFPQCTAVYSLIVDGSHSYIANGYVVSGFAHDSDFDYGNVQWDGLAK